MSCTDTQTDPNAPLIITQGEHQTIEVFAVLGGAAFDATNCKVYFTVKKHWKDAAVVFDKKTANVTGGSDTQIKVIVPQTGDDEGRIEIYLLPADTTALDPDLTYVCDCWLVTTTNTNHVILKLREFVILPRVTVVA